MSKEEKSTTITKVKDSKLIYIEDDIEKVQNKMNLYLKAYGVVGVFHLIKEIIQNAWDECTNPLSNGYQILVTIDTLENSIVVEDNGRGISEADYPLEICCTKLQAGSKFQGDDGGIGAGELAI